MKFINEFKDNLVEIYKDDEYDALLVGYIVAEDDKDILFQLISPMGFKDGKYLILKDRINKLQSNTKYLKEIEILMKENSKENILNSYIFSEKDFSIENKENLFEEFLLKIKNDKMLCIIRSIFEDDKTEGYIEDIDNDYIILSYNNEKKIIKKDEIKSVDIESIDYRRDNLINSKL